MELNQSSVSSSTHTNRWLLKNYQRQEDRLSKAHWEVDKGSPDGNSEKLYWRWCELVNILSLIYKTMITQSCFLGLHFFILLLRCDWLELTVANVLSLILLSIILLTLFLRSPLCKQPLCQMLRYPRLMLPLDFGTFLEKKYARAGFT